MPLRSALQTDMNYKRDMFLKGLVASEVPPFFLAPTLSEPEKVGCNMFFIQLFAKAKTLVFFL